MFDKKVYVDRRNKLRKRLKSGIAVFLGNDESPMNYAGNPYHFRQDSSFLYFFGIDKPGFAGVIDVDEDKDHLFGYDFTVDDIIWMGPQPTVKALARRVGITRTGESSALDLVIKQALEGGRKVHFLPPYRTETAWKLERLTGISIAFIKQHVSLDLIRAVVDIRSFKSRAEVAEIERALDISYDMYQTAMGMIRPGIYESEVVGAIKGIVESRDSQVSFPVILTVHGETLHNHYHGNRMDKGDLLVIDSGAESPEHYASDITRTFPVAGSYTSKQREIYDLVLKSQLEAIKSSKPGKRFKDVHMRVATVIAQGLKDIGLMKGDVAAAVKEGAHALFFPHGLGHMMGLDVHDMEDIGENFVGYNREVKRSDQFGLAYLRMAKRLETGHVLTVEPGIYFIPALIDLWKSEKKHARFINYDAVEKYRMFGGVRIEDDILITDKGARVLGKPIPKDPQEIETIMAAS